MKLSNEKIVKIVVFGFLGLIISFIIGAVTIVLSPFALLYAVGYFFLLIYMFALYIKNKPDEVKASLKLLVDYASDPEAVHATCVRRSKKAAAKRRKKQLKRKKHQARNLAIAYSANKALRNFINN